MGSWESGAGPWSCSRTPAHQDHGHGSNPGGTLIQADREFLRRSKQCGSVEPTPRPSANGEGRSRPTLLRRRSVVPLPARRFRLAAVTTAVALVVAVTFLAPPAQADPPDPGPAAVPGRYIVTLKVRIATMGARSTGLTATRPAAAGQRSTGAPATPNGTARTWRASRTGPRAAWAPSRTSTPPWR